MKDNQRKLYKKVKCFFKQHIENVELDELQDFTTLSNEEYTLISSAKTQEERNSVSNVDASGQDEVKVFATNYN